MSNNMAEPKMSLDRIISIVALVMALAGSAFSYMHNTNQLEYLTKQDFNTFQVENVKKMTQLEGKLENGFSQVTQQLSTLQFVSQKDFLDLKDKSTATAFELQKSIDFLKKDLELLQRNTEANAARIIQLQTQIAVLESQKASNIKDGTK
jgi:hypothetical protein